VSVELVIYGVVAAGLVVWLRSILGTRHGEERRRSNPYLTPVSDKNTEDNLGKGFPVDAGAFSKSDPREAVQDLADNPTDNLSIESGALEGLLQIAKTDKQFDIHDFLSKVQDAYAIAIESFAEGDIETLAILLDKSVFEAFNNAITARAERHEHMQTDIHAVRKAHVTAAHMEGKIAYITVAFEAEGMTVVKDDDGKILSGGTAQVENMTDVWVFKRDTKTADPRWLVSETK
jgi:predicted lipid-binding transport protein (Tim44 family)